jgi:DNA-binding MarR family transcriptional regulator
MAPEKVSSPALTAAEVAVWRGFLRWSESVTAAVAQALTEDAGLSVADYEVLKRLLDADGSLPRQTVEKSLSWSPSRLSHQLRRMEARDLVGRSDAGRGRQVDVELTAAGRALIGAADEVHAVAVRGALLAQVPAEVRAFLRDAVAAVIPPERRDT